MIEVGDRILVNHDLALVIEDDPENHRACVRGLNLAPDCNAWVDYTAVSNVYKAPWPYRYFRKALALMVR